MSPNQGGIAVISRWALVGVRHRPLPIRRDLQSDAIHVIQQVFLACALSDRYGLFERYMPVLNVTGFNELIGQ
jgi:hypothetical protein